eukprot:6190401-Pleurochrysis_carterae.AAC.2
MQSTRGPGVKTTKRTDDRQDSVAAKATQSYKMNRRSSTERSKVDHACLPNFARRVTRFGILTHGTPSTFVAKRDGPRRLNHAPVSSSFDHDSLSILRLVSMRFPDDFSFPPRPASRRHSPKGAFAISAHESVVLAYLRVCVDERIQKAKRRLSRLRRRPKNTQPDKD